MPSSLALNLPDVELNCERFLEKEPNVGATVLHLSISPQDELGLASSSLTREQVEIN